MKQLKELKTKLEREFAELGHKPKIRVDKNGLMIGRRFHVYMLEGSDDHIGFERLDSNGIKPEHHYFHAHIGMTDMILATIFIFYRMEGNHKFSLTYFDSSFEGDFSRFVKDGLAPSAKAMVYFVRLNTIKQIDHIQDECDESVDAINRLCHTRYGNKMWWTKCGKL
jgi:hypothetical protein